MKLASVMLIGAALLSGCLTTTKRGEYTIDVKKVDDAGRVAIGGYFQASPFVSWRETRYGDEPKALVQLLVASLLPNAAPDSYRLTEMRFTRYEPGGNYLGWSVVVSGSDQIVAQLRPKFGKRIEGDFSFEEARLLQVRRERIYP